MNRARTIALIQGASIFFCSLLLIALTGSIAGAQSRRVPSQSEDGITDMSDPATGRSSIEGRLYYPSGHPVDKRIRIELSSVQGGSSSIMSSDNGTFIFRRLPEGTYNLTVNAGPEYETAYETVRITEGGLRSGRGQAVTVQIQLRLKSNTSVRPSVASAELASVPAAARESYLKALSFEQAHEPKKAIEQLERAVKLYPDFALAYNEMGAQYMQLNRLDKAAEAFQSALKIARDAFVPRLNYGYVLLQQKKYAEAEAELRRAIEKNGNSVDAHIYRGRALIRLRRSDEAEKELQRAIAIGGEEANLAHRYLGALYIELGERERAITELETYLKLMPNAQDANQIREIIKGLLEK
ncbi:MAG: tetratricopeptide repeat protein [Acidobacteriota bacterium]|nr:tetratricopeptide repeat protein [Acidobacteriota bacterium]